MDRSSINHRAASGDGLKADLFIIDFHLHIVIVIVEAHVPERTSHIDVAFADFSAGSGDKILDALLRFNAFIGMVMSRENDVDSVASKEGFDYSPQTEIRAVSLSRGVDWMMEDRDLPFCRGLLQYALKPTSLGRVKIGRVHHEEFGQSVAFFDRVIALTAHVELRVMALVLAPVLHVVVSEHGVKLHAFSNKAGVGALEFLCEMTTAAVRVDVVPHCDHQIERRGLVISQYLRRDPGLAVVAGSEIANRGEFNPVLRRRRAENRAWQDSRACSDCCD